MISRFIGSPSSRGYCKDVIYARVNNVIILANCIQIAFLFEEIFYSNILPVFYPKNLSMKLYDIFITVFIGNGINQ